jgi:hypothetical protein
MMEHNSNIAKLPYKPPHQRSALAEIVPAGTMVSVISKFVPANREPQKISKIAFFTLRRYTAEHHHAAQRNCGKNHDPGSGVQLGACSYVQLEVALTSNSRLKNGRLISYGLESSYQLARGA